jgi:hypothetical protein
MVPEIYILKDKYYFPVLSDKDRAETGNSSSVWRQSSTCSSDANADMATLMEILSINESLAYKLLPINSGK